LTLASFWRVIAFMVVRRRFSAAVWIALSCACCEHVGAQGRLFSANGPRGATEAPEEGEQEIARTRHERREREAAQATLQTSETLPDMSRELPRGRDIASLAPSDCVDLLDRSLVRFEQVDDEQAPNVATPLHVLAPLHGVSFGPKNGDPEHGMVDCRLAVALYAWAPILRANGVVKVEHYSTYRPGARVRGHGKPSGHAHALAIDAARFHLTDGRVIDVDTDWQDREHGGNPCPVREHESEASRILRSVVCEAVERDLFQVVLTPHYDRAHQNHVHLELVPDVDWSYVR
jgi:hypothetical protein